jgi:hypothetical protein
LGGEAEVFFFKECLLVALSSNTFVSLSFRTTSTPSSSIFDAPASSSTPFIDGESTTSISFFSLLPGRASSLMLSKDTFAAFVSSSAGLMSIMTSFFTAGARADAVAMLLFYPNSQLLINHQPQSM